MIPTTRWYFTRATPLNRVEISTIGRLRPRTFNWPGVQFSVPTELRDDEVVLRLEHPMTAFGTHTRRVTKRFTPWFDLVLHGPCGGDGPTWPEDGGWRDPRVRPVPPGLGQDPPHQGPPFSLHGWSDFSDWHQANDPEAWRLWCEDLVPAAIVESVLALWTTTDSADYEDLVRALPPYFTDRMLTLPEVFTVVAADLNADRAWSCPGRARSALSLLTRSHTSTARAAVVSAARELYRVGAPPELLDDLEPALIDLAAPWPTLALRLATPNRPRYDTNALIAAMVAVDPLRSSPIAHALLDRGQGVDVLAHMRTTPIDLLLRCAAWPHTSTRDRARAQLRLRGVPVPKAGLRPLVARMGHRDIYARQEAQSGAVRRADLSLLEAIAASERIDEALGGAAYSHGWGNGKAPAHKALAALANADERLQWIDEHRASLPPQRTAPWMKVARGPREAILARWNPELRFDDATLAAWAAEEEAWIAAQVGVEPELVTSIFNAGDLSYRSF